MEKLFLVDAYALIYKYYYAFLTRPMRNRAGMNTSAVFGFVKFLREILRRERPSYLGVAFDPKGGCFRRELYAEYKANRALTPEDILSAVPYIKRILEAMHVPILEVEGYEADDVIGTLSVQAARAGFEVFMVTPDKDYGQLVQEHVKIYKQREEGIEIVDREAIRAHYGFDDPGLVRDVLALWGDASDNIPGVPGIGEKGAIKLVRQWGPVENLLQHTGELTPRQREMIEAGAEQLLLSKRLATIVQDVPIAFCAEELRMDQPDVESLRELFIELGFNSMLHDMPVVVTSIPVPAEGKGPEQAPQRQLARVAAEKSFQRRQAALAGQGELFSGTGAEQVTAAEAIDRAVPDDAGDGFLSVATVPHDYRTVQTDRELEELVARIAGEKELCIDTETSGVDPLRDRLVGLSLAVHPHEAWYIPLPPDRIAARLERLRPLLENEAIAKIGQNLKFEQSVLGACGIRVAGFRIDTMLLHYLLDPEGRHNLTALAQKYLDYSPIPIENLIGRGAKQLSMDMVSEERVAEYSAEDADITLQLAEALRPLLREDGQESLYERIEEPLIEVLADIERTGVRIDCSVLDDYRSELNDDLAALEERIRDLAGEPTLNVNSSRQLGEVLFSKLRIDDKPRMTRTKQFRTDEEYLQSLAARHPIIDLLLEYRGVKKLLTTYVDALPQLVNPVTGRIHTSFNQAVTATGRLSSTNPNLQNIPIRDERGRRIREAFIASDDDHVLLSADYSQVELRLMAHLSGDEALIAAFRSGEDIHRATAARLFNVSPDEVTPEERRRAKTANFGIIYGISAFGLSQRLDIPRAEARGIIEGYFASYPGVKEYMDRVIAEARERGYVATIFGRRRYLNDINSRNAIARGMAERNAINAPIQGSAADIMKLAMIEVHRALRRHALRSKVILQVHDELVVDCLRSEREQVAALVVQAMEGAARLRVPLTVDYGTGSNWLEAH